MYQLFYIHSIPTDDDDDDDNNNNNNNNNNNLTERFPTTNQTL